MLNRTIIATTAVALLLGLRASAAEISWSEKRDLDHGRIEAWIEDGWLHARRVDSTDDLVWHVVLGQVEKGAVPTIEDGSTAEVRHPNGRYFVRDIANQRLNCVRQKLAEGEFAGINTDFLADARSSGWGTGSDLGIAVENLDDYQWVLLGPAHSVGEGEEMQLEIAPNAVLRMTPTLQDGKHARFSTSGAGMIDYSYGKAELSDDGEFLQARYVGMEEAERALNRSKLEQGSIPPELDAERWVNPMPVEQLKNMSQAPVILIDFWATWCTPCVAEMPTVQALYDQYAEQGFIVVALHSAHQSQDMDDFVAEHGYTMPIVLDTGETYRRFGVEGIPQYVLIGRDGRLAETGLLGSVPSAEQIEALLAAN
ncbi:MAG: TlpA disulfide reductase family protein [Gemmatimonadota bacterium]|nr:TlpA disulfide reductase family protein [Gemmatimonadota bacterium]